MNISIDSFAKPPGKFWWNVIIIGFIKTHVCIKRKDDWDFAVECIVFMACVNENSQQNLTVYEKYLKRIQGTVKKLYMTEI